MDKEMMKKRDVTTIVVTTQNEPESDTRAFFFEFEDQRQTLTKTKIPHWHLLMGDLTPTSLFNYVQPRATEIYDHLLAYSSDYFGQVHKSWRRHRVSELFVGRLCWLISFKLSKIEAQVSSLPSQNSFRVFPLKLRLPSVSPGTSAESFEAFNDRNLFGLMQAVLLRLHLNLPMDIDFLGPSFEASREPVYLSKLSHKILAKVTRLVRKSNQHLITATYLGPWSEIRLNLLLGQLPSFPELTRPPKLSPIVRENHLFKGLQEMDIFRLAEGLLKLLTPSALVEHYDSMREHLISERWPAFPDSIFTSNAFEENDLFKVYVAENFDRSNYVVGQHGNNYGVSRRIEPIPEYRTSDRFLSWGWEGVHVEPIGVLTPRLPRRPIKRDSGLLLVLRDKMTFATYLDSAKEYETYFDEVAQLVGLLHGRGFRVTLKPHSASDSISTNRIGNICESWAGIKLAPPRSRMRDFVRKGYLPVFTYDSTGMLELASEGKVFFAFLPEGTGHVKQVFRENYAKLEEANLMDETAFGAAEKISSLIDNPDAEPFLQGIRGFAEGIAFRNPRLISQLARSLDPDSFDRLGEMRA